MSAPRVRAYGQGTVYERNGIWYVGLGVGGRFIKKSSHSRNRADAVRLLKELQAEFAVGKPVLHRADRIKVADLLSDLLTDYKLNQRASLKVVRAHVKVLNKEIGHLAAIRLTRPKLQQLVKKWRDAGGAPATCNKRMGTLRRAFTLAVENQHLQYVPRFPRLPEHNARQVMVEQGDFDRLLMAVEDHDLRDYFEWLYITGQRRGEAAKLRWTYVDKNRTTITVPDLDTKTREGRALPIHGDLAEIIERRWQARKRHSECPFVFFRVFGRKVRPVGQTTKSWRSALRKVGLPGSLRVHDFRRSALVNMTRTGRIDQKVIMRFTGHKTNSTFLRYRVVQDTDMRAALDALAADKSRSKLRTLRPERTSQQLPKAPRGY